MRRHSLAIGVALMGGAVSLAQAETAPAGALRSPLGVNTNVEIGSGKVVAATAEPVAAVKAVPSPEAAKPAAVSASPVVEAKPAPLKAADVAPAVAKPAEPKVAESKPPVAAPVAAALPAGSKPAAGTATQSKDTKPVAVATAPSNDTKPAVASEATARQALAKSESDADNKKLLESVLESSERNYSLLKKGNFDFNYDFNYTFFGNESLDVATAQNASGEAVLSRFSVNKAATHAFTNTLIMDYGLLNNVTVGASVPMVHKIDVQGANRKRWVTGMGDISANLRWQPFSVSRTLPSLTFNGSLRLPTGVSPYDVNAATELSTGSGTFGLSLGGNISKVVDPIVLYSSLTWGTSFEKTGLNQLRGNEGRRIQAVEPGDNWSFGMGMGYALSYDVSLNLSTSMSYSKSTVLHFNNEVSTVLDPSTSGSLNIGVGWRLDPKFTLNLNTGIGLTRESPDFSMGASMPINF